MFSFKSFLKALVFLFSLLIIIIIFSGISYFVIDKVQTKNNLMDIEEYSPISTLVVPQNSSKKSKYPFVDVHSHHWDMPIADLSGLVNEMDSLNMGYMINLSGSGFATFSGNQTLMDLNLSKSLKNVKENYPNRFGIFVNLDLNKIRRKLINFPIPGGRGDIKVVNKFKKKFKFIDESYNANPLSMSSAIKNISHYKRQGNLKKIVLLGDMLELGKKTKKYHKELSIVINKSDIDKVFVYGKYIRETFNLLSKNKKGKVFNNLREAHNHLSKIIHNNDLLMVKGSNATGLNQFSKNIKRGYFSAI